MSDVPITFSLAAFPDPFSGTQEVFKDVLVSKLVAAATSPSNIIVGKIGGTTPTSDVGPWASNRQSWKTWGAVPGSPTIFKYLYNTIAVGNKDHLIRMDGTPSANRSLLLQDKNGIAALTDDLYIPRQSYPLSGAALFLDWNLSNTFYHELTSDTAYYMRNSRHGQEIRLLISNPALWSVAFYETGFVGGVQPAQSKFIASVLTDVTVTNTSKLIISAMAGFTISDVGLTVTTAGNTPIPASTTIAKVLSPTHALLSNVAVASGTNISVTINSRAVIGRSDLWILKNVGGSVYARVIQQYPGLLRAVGTALSDAMTPPILILNPPPPDPFLSPIKFGSNAGHEASVPGDLIITMMASDPAVAIRYTTDGSIPTATTGFLISGTTASYVLAQGLTVELNAIAVGEDNSVSTYRRALYTNVFTVPDTTKTNAVDNTSTGQSRLDRGAADGLMPTKT